MLVVAVLVCLSGSALAATFIRVSGTVASVADDKSYVNVTLSTGAEHIFRVDSNTSFISAATGEAVGIASIKAGDKFTAWHGEATTASIPAQSYLHTMIVTAAGTESYAHFIYVKSVRYDGNNVVLTNDAGDILITVEGSTSVKQFVANGYAPSSAQNIYPNAQIIAWYETVTESYPAQATATRVIVLSDGKATPSATPNPTSAPTATPSVTVNPAPTATPGAVVRPPQTGSGASFAGFAALGLAVIGTVSVIAKLKKEKNQ